MLYTLLSALHDAAVVLLALVFPGVVALTVNALVADVDLHDNLIRHARRAVHGLASLTHVPALHVGHLPTNSQPRTLLDDSQDRAREWFDTAEHAALRRMPSRRGLGQHRHGTPARFLIEQCRAERLDRKAITA